MKNIVIVGATSSIAEHCARLWLIEPSNLLLVGRNQNKLELIARDLKVRSPLSEIKIIVSELVLASAIDRMMQEIYEKMPMIDKVLIAHGVLSDQIKCQYDSAACRESLNVNAVSPVLILESFAKIMESTGSGKIAIIGSVAGDRGKKSNYIYGAAKGMIERYTEGMQHRFAGSAIHVLLIKPGPTDTPMTVHMKSSGLKLSSVESVAQEIVIGIERNKRVIYAPKKWKYLMLIIKLIPFWIFKKINV